MPRPWLALVVSMVAVLASVPCVRADGLKSAQVSRVFNDVRLQPENQPARPAVVSDTVSGKAAVQTGAASRTELTFSDKTLTRLGANSYFSFVNGTRDMNLGSGTMLLQVPKDAGGATIHTAAVTAAITGTTLMVEFNPKSYSKIIVLEGTVRVYLTARVGESLLVHAGEMVIVPPTAKTLPEAVTVDLSVLYLTSGLIKDFGPLRSDQLIDREIVRQKKEIGGGRLLNTELYIVGRGTEVQSGNLTYVNQTNVRITAGQSAHQPLGVEVGGQRTPLPPPPPVVTPTLTPTPETPTPPPTPASPTPASPTPTPASPTPTPGSPSPTPATPTPPPPTASPTPATPTPPPPTPNKFGPLPLITGNDSRDAATYDLGTSTAIRTDPFITTNGVQGEGRIYRGGTTASPSGAASADGLPSFYLLGAAGGPTTFDQQVGFDTQFGTMGQIGAFRFGNLAITGAPASISTVGGPANLALVADGQITDAAGSFNNRNVVFDLTGLGNVLLATRNGAITFNRATTFQNLDGTVPSLTMYARGGALTLDYGTRLALGGALNLYSDSAIVFNAQPGSNTTVVADTLTLVSGGYLAIGNAALSAGDLAATFNTGGGVVNTAAFSVDDGAAFSSLTGQATATGSGGVAINGTAAARGLLQIVTTTGDFTTGTDSRLQSIAGRVNLTATTGDMTLDGSLAASTGGSLRAGGGMELNGTIRVSQGSFVAAASGPLRVTGTVTDSPLPGGIFSLRGSDLLVDTGALVTVTGNLNTDSDLTATGELNVNGTVAVGTNRLLLSAAGDLNTGAAASVTSNFVTAYAQGSVNLDLSRFQPGNATQSSAFSISGGRVNLSTSTAHGYVSPYGSISVNATGLVTLAQGNYQFSSVQTTNANTSDNPGNFIVPPSNVVSVGQLQLGGDLSLDAGTTFTLRAGATGNRVGGGVNYVGSPALDFEAPLTVAGSIQPVGGDDIVPTLTLGAASGPLTVVGNLNLAQGSIAGVPGSAINAGGNLTAGGDVRVQTLNAAGNIVVGSLAALTVTTNLLDGSANPAITDTTVAGAVTPFTPGAAHTFSLGRFAADGGLQFAGSTDAGNSLDAASLALTVRGDIRFGPSGTPGQSVASVNFNGADNPATTDAPTAGRGGSFAVTTRLDAVASGRTTNALAPPSASISIQSVAAPTPPTPEPSPSPGPSPYSPPPTLTATGGSVTGIASGTSGSGGAGGSLSFTSAQAITVSSGAMVDASGGGFFAGQADPITAASGGAGGRVSFTAATDLTVNNANGNFLGRTTLQADGGSVVSGTAPAATPGAGGTINLRAGGALNLFGANVLADGGGIATSFGVLGSGVSASAPGAGGGDGGQISLVSTGTHPDTPDLSVTSSLLSANTGVNGSATASGGKGGQITLSSTDTAASTVAAVLLDNARIVVSNDGNYVDDGSASERGGTLTVTSARTGGAGISVQDSSSLLALVSSRAQGPGGQVVLRTDGANIAVDQSTVLAGGAGSQVLVTTGSATAAASAVTLTDATLGADTLKIQALGPNGNLTIGGSSTLSGDTQLSLYAGNGSGAGSLIEFTGNTTLSSNHAGVLSAYTIKVDDGVQVDVTGPALTLYTNQPHFSGPHGDNTTSGTFEGSGVGSVSAYGSAPAPAPSAPAGSAATPALSSTATASRGGRPRPVAVVIGGTRIGSLLDGGVRARVNGAAGPGLPPGGAPRPGSGKASKANGAFPADASPARSDRPRQMPGVVARPGSVLRP